MLTHCNAGGLATSDYGTALAVFFAAAEAGKTLHVYADETRPLLQGARLTAWELQQRGIDVTLICDSMAAQVMREGRVQAVVTGADRIAANGDTANKIGTYGVAVLAAAHKIPFYVAAPSSTFDLSIQSGAEIPIEAARPAGNHARLRPADRPGGGRRLQSGVRRDPGGTDRGDHLRARRDPAGRPRNDRRDAGIKRLGWRCSSSVPLLACKQCRSSGLRFTLPCKQAVAHRAVPCFYRYSPGGRPEMACRQSSRCSLLMPFSRTISVVTLRSVPGTVTRTFNRPFGS